MRCESKGEGAQSYALSTLDIDVSLHRGIPPGRPPDLSLMRDILSLISPLLDFGEVKSFRGEFSTGDVKVVGSSMKRASHTRSPALSLGRIDPYWRSQLLVEYSKDLSA